MISLVCIVLNGIKKWRSLQTIYVKERKKLSYMLLIKHLVKDHLLTFTMTLTYRGHNIWITVTDFVEHATGKIFDYWIVSPETEVTDALIPQLTP